MFYNSLNKELTNRGKGFPGSNRLLKRSAVFQKFSAVLAVLFLLSLMVVTGTPVEAAGNPYHKCSNNANCTWYAWQKWHDWGVDMPNFGNAKDWAGNAARYGYRVDGQPQVKAIVVFQPGVGGANRIYGHVAVVEEVSGNRIKISEQNCDYSPSYNVRWTRWDISGLSFIHFPTSGGGGGSGGTTHSGEFKLASVNMCLNAHHRTDWSPVNFAICDQPDPDQLWTLKADGELKLQSVNMCLNAHHHTDQALVNFATCDQPDPDQLWTYRNDGKLQLQGTNLCLAAQQRYNWSPVNLATCGSSNINQTWVFR